MREKYFSQGDFLKAKLGARPSYAWRSIFNAKDLLSNGLVWRVGNRSDIKIWQDRWIPRPVSYTVHSPVTRLDPTARVSALLDLDAGWWNFPLIQSIFSPDEAQLICSLTPNPSGQADKRIWVGTASGLFTVKSAYHLQKELVQRAQGECSSDSGARQVWTKIWSMRVLRAV
jgi:hypothetical protein